MDFGLSERISLDVIPLEPMVWVNRERPELSLNGSLALRDVSFHVPKGEFVFLTGPSGAGKSSILKLIYMDELPTRGDVWVSGTRSRGVKRRDISKLRRRLGVVFQDFRLLPNRTAYENVAFALEVIGKSKGVARRVVPEVLELVGLGGKEHRYPHELSGGEQQRVAVARAFVNRPLVLLADEPTGNLDASIADFVATLLLELHAARQTILIVVTHSVSLAARLPRRFEMRARVSDGCRWHGWEVLTPIGDHRYSYSYDEEKLSCDPNPIATIRTPRTGWVEVQ